MAIPNNGVRPGPSPGEERFMATPHPSGGFTLSQSVAVIAMGVTVGCIPALQPILLGGLLGQHRLTAAQIGQAATAEAIGMALAMTLAALLLKPDRLKPLALAAILAAVAANAATGFLSGFAVVLLRAVNGAASGVLLWILVGFTARAMAPGRVFAIYVTAQASVAFAMSILLSQWIVPALGAAGGYALLTLADAALLMALSSCRGSTLRPRPATPAAPRPWLALSPCSAAACSWRRSWPSGSMSSPWAVSSATPRRPLAWR